MTITDEIRESELLECQGELLRKSGSHRENSFIEIKEHEADLSELGDERQYEELDTRPCYSYERITTTEACEVIEFDAFEDAIDMKQFYPSDL